ncbi:hypothetical protein [Frankia sp. AgB32]|uniref:hypothetical protein n=1 Tax=Frankia sp. AgB32 TaxID=631119 RepID=UPI00200E0204|nr:hypothetical protein [Frankia sp. AgB32]MCK9897276.1 hypothetical protein [Frankia sp. AgB32]
MDQNFLDTIAVTVDLLLGADHSAGFSGLVVSAADGVVTVYRTAPYTAEIDRVLRENIGMDHLVVATAPYSRAYLRQISDRIVADWEFWRQRGVVLSSVGAAARGESVRLGIEDEASAPAVLEYYAGLPITIVQEKIIIF